MYYLILGGPLVLLVLFLRNQMKFCHNCKSSDIILDYQAGDLICTSCGLVISGRMIDESDETRVYSEDYKKKETRSSGKMTAAEPIF